jgi:hypothetical protein
MDFYNDILTDTYRGGGTIRVPMTGHTFAQAIGSTKRPVSQFPQFGAFVIRRIGGQARGWQVHRRDCPGRRQEICAAVSE